MQVVIETFGFLNFESSEIGVGN
jgi:hypothetical protein